MHKTGLISLKTWDPFLNENWLAPDKLMRKAMSFSIKDGLTKRIAKEIKFFHNILILVLKLINDNRYNCKIWRTKAVNSWKDYLT